MRTNSPGKLGGVRIESLRDDKDKDLTERLASDSEETPFVSCLRSEIRHLLECAISELPEKKRQVLTLYYYDNLTMKEVGAAVGIGESRVSQIHSLVMARLRVRMNQLIASNDPNTDAKFVGAV